MPAFTIPALQQSYGGVTLSAYLWCAGFIVVALLFKKPFARLVAHLTSGIAARFTGGKYRVLFKSLVRKPLEWLFASILLFLGLNQIEPLLTRVQLLHLQQKSGAAPVTLADAVTHLFFFFAILFTTLTLSRITDFIYRSEMEHAHHAQQAARAQILPLIKELVKGLLWTIAFFWILGVVFQVNIPALITGLGIGGVALALAAKESIENLFAAFTILTDKPFQVGDTVRVSGLEGQVQRIGFRSARLRGSDGSQYVIPNKKLVGENLENLTQRDTRGVNVVLSIKNGLSEDALQRMIGELKGMMQQTLQVIEPVKVSLGGFTESVFQVTLSYHLPPQLTGGASEDDIKQEINRRAYGIVLKYTTPVQATTKGGTTGPATITNPTQQP